MAKDAESLRGFEGRVAEGRFESGAVIGAGSERAELTVEQILAWADAHHATHGHWPVVGVLSGPVDGVPGESWKAINHALALGLRGLPGDSSLAELLAEQRGAPMPDMGPRALADKIWEWEQEQFPLKGPRRSVRQYRKCQLLTEDAILAWADLHHAATGEWPKQSSGPVRGAPFEDNWQNVNNALQMGFRGLPGGSSLYRLLVEKRGAGFRLTLEQVLAWADAHYAATGSWPTLTSGKVIDAPRENWANLDTLLRVGQRGLLGGLSVLRLLTEHRGVHDRRFTEPLSIGAILAWADAHHAATGQWPSADSGPVRDAPYDLTWKVINGALRTGQRGLPGGQSLGRLLAEHRAVRAPLSLEKILAWADAHHAATGAWPTFESGPVKGVWREDWAAIDINLKNGHRGLPGRQALCRILAEHRGVPDVFSRKPLSIDQILAWADAFHETHGRWPTLMSGPVASVPGETWSAIDSALQIGGRGLVQATSLARLLIEHRGPDSRNQPPRLTLEQALAWADAHHAATGRWPSRSSGPLPEAPGESWRKIASALKKGQRGLPSGLSLACLRAQKPDRHPRTDLPDLTHDQILAWADAHHATHGCWPTRLSGPVPEAPGETWEGIATAMTKGERGLTRGPALRRLLATRREVQRPPLNLTMIQAWANDYRQTTGSWPRIDSGAVPGAPGENWHAINAALKMGNRGLPGGMSLAEFLRSSPEASTPGERPDLTVEQVLAWAKAHHAAHGHWPGRASGPIPGAPGENWDIINYTLRLGRRGLPGGLTVAKLIAQYRSQTPRQRECGSLSSGAQP